METRWATGSFPASLSRATPLPPEPQKGLPPQASPALGRWAGAQGSGQWCRDVAASGSLSTEAVWRRRGGLWRVILHCWDVHRPRVE